jgi:anti-anti-sigma factor
MNYSDAMKDITPPEVLNQNSVTIVRLGEDYANFFENMLDNLSFIQQLAQSVTPPRLVVDLRHVKFIGSAFLGLMVTVYKTLTARESGRFALCGLNSFCQAAVSISKLQNRFEIFETVDDAVKAFSADL